MALPFSVWDAGASIILVLFSALLNFQRKLLKVGGSLDEVLTYLLNYKKYPISYQCFFSVIVAQDICNCFIALLDYSL